MSSNGNFVRINNSIMKWQWYTDIPTKVLFMHLILKANFATGKFKDIVVERGQTVTSSQHLADECGLSRQQVRTAIEKLLATNEITYTSTNQYCVITLNNYETYNPIGKTATSKATSNVTIKQPANNHRITTIEEEEEEKEGKEEKDLCDFEEVWNVLPSRNGRKLERPQALKKYKSLPLKDRAAILTAATNYANSKQVKDGIGIKDPKRWLSNWKDWHEDVAPTNGATAAQITDIFAELKRKAEKT